MINENKTCIPYNLTRINVKIFVEWYDFFVEQRLKAGESMSLHMRYVLIEVLTSMQKPLSAKNIDLLKASMEQVKMQRGGRGVARGLKNVRLFLGPATSLELRLIANDNQFALSDLLRAIFNLYLQKKGVPIPDYL